MLENYNPNIVLDEKKKKKKLLILTLFCLASVLIISGIVAAYFSDMFTSQGTGSTGTLKISGTHTYYVNGVDVASTELGNLNPGDVVVIHGTVTNIGTHSAWIRDRIDFSASNAAILPHLKIFRGQHTQDSILSGTDLSAYNITLLPQGYFAGGNMVINGSDNVESGGDFDYVNSTTYDYYFTVYFDINATNEAQDLSLSFAVTTQALQFKNNNTNEPTEEAWNSVTAVAT